MKTMAKVCLTAAGVLAVLGVLGLALGMILGGGAAVLQSFEYLPGIRHFTQNGAAASDSGETEQIFYDVENLELHLTACELELSSHSEPYIKVSASNMPDTFSCTQDDNHLLLEDQRETIRDFAVGYMNQSLCLTILLPEDGLKALDISLDAGEIEAEMLSADSVTIDCDLGSLEADCITARNVNLTFDLGDVDLGRLEAADSAVIEAACGDVCLEDYEGCDLTLVCDVGNISVCARGYEADYNYELSCDLGNILLGRQHHGGHHKDHIVQNPQAARRICIRCDLGDLELDFSEEE